MMEMNGHITEQELDSLAELIPAEPAMRRDIVLAMLRHAEAPAESEQPQRIEVKEERKPGLPRYVLQKRWDIRLRDWAVAWVSGWRLVYLGLWLLTATLFTAWKGPSGYLLAWIPWLALPSAQWWIALPWRAGSFARAVTGGKIKNGFEVAERDGICERCDQRYVFVRLNGETSEHCQACKCPPTRWSALDYKNQLEKWHCPLRKHPGPYPNDGQAVVLKGLGYEENAVLSAVGGGGCSGCGCGKAAK